MPWRGWSNDTSGEFRPWDLSFLHHQLQDTAWCHIPNRASIHSALSSPESWLHIIHATKTSWKRKTALKWHSSCSKTNLPFWSPQNRLYFGHMWDYNPDFTVNSSVCPWSFFSGLQTPDSCFSLHQTLWIWSHLSPHDCIQSHINHTLLVLGQSWF